MALALCQQHGEERVRRYEHPITFSEGKSHRVGRGFEPDGHPNSAVVCRYCTNPALIWLGESERRAYYGRGERVFAFPAGGGRVRLL